MQEIKEFDTIVLKDGREGAVVDVLGDQDIFLVDVGSSPDDWETIEVKLDEIERIKQKAK